MPERWVSDEELHQHLIAKGGIRFISDYCRIVSDVIALAVERAVSAWRSSLIGAVATDEQIDKALRDVRERLSADYSPTDSIEPIRELLRGAAVSGANAERSRHAREVQRARLVAKIDALDELWTTNFSMERFTGIKTPAWADGVTPQYVRDLVSEYAAALAALDGKEE